MDTYLTKQLSYYDYCSTLQACNIRQKAADATLLSEDEAPQQQQQQQQLGQQQQQQLGQQQQQPALQQQQHAQQQHTTATTKKGKQAKRPDPRQRTLFQLPGMKSPDGISSQAGADPATVAIAAEAGPSETATARAAAVAGSSQQAATATLSAAVASSSAAAAQAPALATPAAAAVGSDSADLNTNVSAAGNDDAPTWDLQPFPDRKKLHGGTFSQGFITHRVFNHWEPRSSLARAIIHSARGRRIAMDYQFYPCKMVQMNKDKAATAIFNMVDVETGDYQFLLQ